MDGYLETEAPETEYGDYFDSDYEYVTRKIQCICDAEYCGTADHGTTAELVKRGWTFSPGAQWCAYHR